MGIKKGILLLFAATGLLLPSFSFAIEPSLVEIYEDRMDLQQSFSADNYQAIPGSAAGFLIDLEDWARQYGWQTYPELSAYAPEVGRVQANSSVLPPEVTAENYIVIDNATGEILAAQNADVIWPIASMTKLVTAKIAFDEGIDFYGTGSVEDIDDVGGARLWVDGGTTFYVYDLFRATLVASANNAANAIARLTGLSKEQFVQKMNAFAESKNLGRTQFVDPTGIEVANQSTAREVAFLAMEVFKNENVRRIAGTSGIKIAATDGTDYERSISSTNWLLYDPAYDDIYVTAGKTGYLYESAWNLVVRMHPMGEGFDKSVVVVVMGSDSRREASDDAANLARWAWNNFDWSRK